MQNPQVFVQHQIVQSHSTGSLHHNRSTASLASAASVISDTGGAPTALPQRSSATVLGGESLQPYLAPTLAPHQPIPASAGPNLTYTSSPPGAPASHPSRPGVLQSHSQGGYAAPAGHNVQYHAQQRVITAQSPGLLQPTANGVACAPGQFRPVEPQPVWVIEEVVDFGVPIDDNDNSVVRKSVRCFGQDTNHHKGRDVNYGEDGIFATCLRPSCKSPDLCPEDDAE